METIIDNTPIAIVGLGCLLPGASDQHALWDLVRTGSSSVVRVPDKQFDRHRLFNPKKGVVGCSYSDLAALIDYSVVDVNQIAESFPFLNTAELKKWDPAHIAYGKTVVEAMESARMTPTEFAGKSVGVYIGHATPSGLGADYSYGIIVPEIADVLRDIPALQKTGADIDRLIASLIESVRRSMPQRSPNNNPTLAPFAAARNIANAYRLNGPAVVFNSSCASSLQAFAHATKAIRRGEIDAAIVGGASCFHVNTLVLFALAHSLSATGSCPFTEAADGLIVGEGYVSVILKRLPDALRDGNPILAVVRGVGVSSDGKGKSLWAPRSEGQTECIRRAYSGLDPSILEGLQYIECHATSTHLGDATEMEALTKVLRDSGIAKYRQTKSIPIGSIKRNIGHTLENSGLAGLAKILVLLEHEVIPAAVPTGCELNKSVEWDAIPMFPPDKPITWKRDKTIPRRAAVESFGIGGLNVHLAVEDYVAQTVSTFHPVKNPSQSSDDYFGELNSVAIIGTGVILPNAKSIKDFRECLKSGQVSRSSVPEARWSSKLYKKQPIAAVIKGYAYDWKRHKVPPKQLEQASPLQFMFLDAVDQAFQSAGYIDAEGNELKPIPRERIGCIVGTSFGGDFSSQLGIDMRVPDIQMFLEQNLSRLGVAGEVLQQINTQFADKVYKKFPALIDETGSFTASSLASRITKSYNLKGGGVAVDAGTGSTGAAIDCCIDMLLDGSSEMMFCLCGEQDLTPERFLIHEILGELEEPAATAGTTPLGRLKSGIVPGEGCVVFLLKRLADAKRDGDPVLGILRGIGSASQPDAAIGKATSKKTDNAKPAAVETVCSGTFASETAVADTLRRFYPNRPIDTCIDQFGYLRTVSGAIALLTALEALDAEQIGQSRLATDDPAGRLCMAVHVTGDINSVQHFILQRGKPVKPITATLYPSMKQFIHFDATERRRERLRAEANAKSGNLVTAKPIPPAPVPVMTVIEQPAVKAPVPAPVAAPVTEKVLNPSELEAFLVNFVVDQTGYPPEIVDMDVDLEADLGIDSIKKAQLFGEIGQYFDIKPSDDLTLDQFPTLRSVMKFLLSQSSPQPMPQPSSPVTVSAPINQSAVTKSQEKVLNPSELEAFLVNFVVDQTGYPPEIVDMDVDLEADLGIDSIKKAQLFGEIGQYFDIKPSDDLTLDQFPTLRSVMEFLLSQSSPQPMPQPSSPVTVSAPINQSAVTKSQEKALNPSELEAFLVNFVVDQTGYPPEIVDLDVDLEADLGIDSIKKAQLFGEIGQYFDIKPSDDLTLDQFPTLRSVMKFLLKT